MFRAILFAIQDFRNYFCSGTLMGCPMTVSRFPYLLSMAGACVLLSCTSSDWSTRVSWPDIDTSHIPQQKDFPDAGAVILLDEGSMEILGGGGLTLSVFEQHRVVKIFNPSGHRFAYVVIPYGSGTDVAGIQARTIDPDGKITVLNENNIFDVSLYPNFIFFSDQRARLFTLPGIVDGSIVEYRYRLNFPRHMFWHSWVFQDVVPTLLSRFSLLKPGEWNSSYRQYGIRSEPKEKRVPSGFKSETVWELRDIPPLKVETAMPPMRETVTRLALSPLGFRTWDDVGEWYHTIAGSRLKAGPEVKALARRLTDGVSGREEKLHRVYEWVRDRVRYVAVEVGIGGFQPHAAEEVCSNMYGDCKDMTTLLCSLAAEAGVEVRQVLISTWQNGRPDTSLPSPLHFNHVIAYAPASGDSGIWMDATEKGCPFGQLPWSDQGLPALVVGEGGKPAFCTTPRSTPDNNSTVLQWDVSLEPSGEAKVHGKTVMAGTPAAEFREELIFSTPETRRTWVEQFIAVRFSGARLDSLGVEGLQPVDDPLVISYDFSTTGFGTRRDNHLVIRPAMISASSPADHFRPGRRVHPVRFKGATRTDLNLTVKVRPGWNCDTLGISRFLDSQFGSAQWSGSWRDTVFTLSGRECLNGADVAPQDYARFQGFLDRLREEELREVVFSRKKE
jgi:hypothetical protein